MTEQNSISLLSMAKNLPSPVPMALGIKNAVSFVSRQLLKGEISYPAFIEYAAQKYADNVLIKHDNTQFTYRQFNERVNQIAHFLRGKNIGQGDTVALFMENRPEYLIYLTAITKTGAVAALVNNAQQGKVLTHSFNLVNPKAIITGDEVAEHLDAVAANISSEPLLFNVPDRGAVQCQNFANIHEASQQCATGNLKNIERIDPDSPCLYIYTSGTTGLPKASIQRHKKVVGIAVGLGMLAGSATSRDTVYSTLPLYHGTALYFSWLTVLANGAGLAIRRKFSASSFWDDVIRYDATIFVYVGELCRYLLNQPESPKDKQHKIRLITGNGMRPELWQAFKARFAIKEVREFYGSSEGNLVCYNLFNQDSTMGLVLGSYAVVKVDAETETPIRDQNGFLIKCQPGEPGLLIGRITKVTPFDGYTDAEKNESKVIHNAFSKGDAWFNSGDLVKTQGARHLQFVDRLGDTFRWKGENVSTGEVEMIVNQFPQISESITYGVEIPNTNGRAGMTAVVLNEGVAELDYEGLYRYLSKELPAYAVPLFVRTLNSVDSTGTFKYQRSSLKKQAYYPQSYENKNDRLYIKLPNKQNYCPATEEIVSAVDKGKYNF